MTQIGFIGSGRVARIMLEGWKRAGALPDAVKVNDIDVALADGLAADYPNVATATLDEVARQDVVVVGLHPPVAAEILPKIARLASPRRDRAVARAETAFRQADTAAWRLRPTGAAEPECAVDRRPWYNPIAFADGLDATGRDTLRALIAPLGAAPEVDECTIEAYALISAMGPTYLWFQLELLRQMAIEFGLSETAAREAVAAMVHGAATTLLESDLPIQQVLDLVPVKPLAADEATIIGLYRSRLAPLYAKLAA